MNKQSGEFASMVRAEDERLAQWLRRLDNAYRGLRSFVGENGQPSRLQPFTQWFQVRQGAAIAVTPKAGLELHGGTYSALPLEEEARWPTMNLTRHHTSSEPFLGGVAIRAKFHDPFMNKEGLLVDLICMQLGADGRPPVVRDNAPNANYFGDAVVIPSAQRPQVDFQVVGDDR